MRRSSDFIPTSVARGLHMNEFMHLSAADRKKLVRLMARIAEKSYRRGFDHGVFFVNDREPRLRDDPDKWRYDTDLDLSPWADSPTTTTSIDRLFMECGVLHEIGFEEPGSADPRSGYRKPVWTGYSPKRRAQLRAMTLNPRPDARIV